MTIIDAKTLRSWQLDQRDFTLVKTLPLPGHEKPYLSLPISSVLNDIIEYPPLQLPGNGTMLVVYCASKKYKDAGLAAERLESLGYARGAHFVGGEKDWITAGYPLE